MNEQCCTCSSTKGVQELLDTVWDGSKDSIGWLEVTCPKCMTLIHCNPDFYKNPEQTDPTDESEAFHA